MKKRIIAITTALFIMAGSVSFASTNDFLILVNQTHPIGEGYKPLDSDDISRYVPAIRSVVMRDEAVKSYVSMYNKMVDEGVSGMKALSGYRAYSYQKMLFDSDVSRYMNQGYSYQDAYNITKANVAVPGQSEHQTGLAVDVTIDGNLSLSFGNTNVGSWMKNNSYKYGFILRYDSNKKNITGINFEPWHFRYVGYPHSEIMFKNGMSLEEYTEYIQNSIDFEYEADDGEVYRITYNSDSDIPGMENVLGVSSNNSGGYVITSKMHMPEGKGYISGYNNEFSPDANMTRAEAATIIARALGNYDDTEVYKSNYSDVDGNAWYYNVVGYMDEEGIIKGYEDGSFRPDNPISRAEFASVISRMKDLKGEYENVFSDIDGHWAKEDIVRMHIMKWVNGYKDGSFRPENSITRAEAVTIANNVLGLDIDKEYIDSNLYSFKRFKDIDNNHWAYYQVMIATNTEVKK